MSAPAAAPIRLRARCQNGVTDVTVLMPHPMETGLLKDAAGAFKPAHYITDVRIALGARTVLQARMSIAVSQDPLLAFRFRGGAPGERLRATWTDNRGEQRSDDTAIVG